MSLVEIAVTNTRARIRAKDQLIYGDVDKLLSYFSKVAPYQKSYKVYLRDKEKARKEGRTPRGWNGITHLFRDSDKSFPAGLSERLAGAMQNAEYEIAFHDNRIRPDSHPKLTDGYIVADPREWQTGAFEAAKANERGVFEAATGTGKTTLMAQNIAHYGQPSLVLVNRNTLAKQTLTRFQSIIRFPHAENPFGIIGDGIWEPGLITIATYQTLHSMLISDKKGTMEWLRLFKALHVDEAHHVPARTFYDLTNATEECFYRYGYSATPFKSDKETELRLVGVCGEIIYSYTALDAIKDGVLAPPHIYVVDPDFSRLAKAKADEDGKYHGKFGDEYKEGIVDHRERNHLLANLAEICADAHLPTLVLVRQNAQGRRLRQLIDDSEYINGSTSTEGREEAKRRLGSGDLPVLIASTIFNEGEDIPAVGALILGGGYRAEHLAMQMVGRGLRPSPGKKFVLVFDCYDSQSFRLERHSKSRIKAWRDAGFNIHIVDLDELEALMDKKGFFG